MGFRRRNRTPRIVLALVARDEADVIEESIAFHLAMGVEHIVALDNGSTDGTGAILERYARAGKVSLLRDEGVISQEEQMTRLARIAASELGADWVIDADADEFWVSHWGTLADVFGELPPWVGKVHAPWWHFPPRPGTGHFAERMTARLVVPRPPKYHVHVKVAHRARADVVVAGGNHDASAFGLLRARRSPPIDVLHFPLRSREQLERKFRRRLEITPDEASERYREAFDAIEKGRIDELWRSYILSDEELEAGLREGTFVIDRRVADALRALGLTGSDDVPACP